MVTFAELLDVIYQIQGASDPNQGESSLKGRMDEIYERCTGIMQQSGYEPDAGVPSLKSAVRGRYRYVNAEGSAITECPGCGRDWEKDGGVRVDAVVAGEDINFGTSLDPEGFLRDQDGVIAGGGHAGTYCGGCDELLLQIDGVVESEVE